MGRKLNWLLVAVSLSCGLGLFSPLWAQGKATLRGTIVDEITKRPVANVNVFIAGTRLGDTSDDNGRFQISRVSAGQVELHVQHISYKPKKINITLRPGEIKSLTVYLTPAVLSLKEVVFTASRFAESAYQSHQDISLVPEEQIELRTSPNTADALREIPGVLVQKTTAGHGAPIMRGLIGKDVLLLYNGIRLNKPTFRFGANQYMNTIDVESLDRIEVVKGPGSVMFGSDAIGGIVNMISETPFSFEQIKQMQTGMKMRYGSADQSRIFHSSFRNRFGRVVFSSGITVKKIGDLRAGSDVGVQKPTGYDEWNGNLKMGFKLNRQATIDFDFLAVQQNKVPRYDKYVEGTYQTYIYDPQDRYLSAITLYYRPEFTSWINSLQWNVSYQLEEEGKIQQKTGKIYRILPNNKLRTFGSYLQMHSMIGRGHILTYGYEIYVDKLKSTSFREENGIRELVRGEFPDGSSYLSAGLFLSDNILFTPGFDVTLGLRYSHMRLSSNLEAPFGLFEDSYGDLTGTFSFSYKLWPWLNVIGTYAKGFRAPNFNDTVVLKVSNAGVDAPSPGLSPEKSHNVELGMKLERENLTGSLFVFYNRLVDLIDRYRGTYQGLDFYDENGNGIRDADEAPIYQKRNVARAYIAGWELAGRYQISPDWLLRGNAFWTYGQNITYDEPMSRIPPLMGLFACRYQPKQTYFVEMFVRAAGKQDRLSTRDKDDSRIDPNGTPGWWTLNLRATMRLNSSLRLNVALENIFDKTYKEHGSGIYSPGRNFVVSLFYSSP